jgi:hypothetical protein
MVNESEALVEAALERAWGRGDCPSVRVGNRICSLRMRIPVARAVERTPNPVVSPTIAKRGKPNRVLLCRSANRKSGSIPEGVGDVGGSEGRQPKGNGNQ